MFQNKICLEGKEEAKKYLLCRVTNNDNQLKKNSVFVKMCQLFNSQAYASVLHDQYRLYNVSELVSRSFCEFGKRTAGSNLTLVC